MMDKEVARWILKDNPSSLNQLIAWIENLYPEMVDDIVFQMPRTHVLATIAEAIIYEYATDHLEGYRDYHMVPIEWIESISLMVGYIIVNPDIDMFFKRRLIAFGFDLKITDPI